MQQADGHSPQTAAEAAGSVPLLPVLLPLPLRFLAEHGVAPEPLHRAARLAIEWGVAPEDALFAIGALRPEAYAQALAAEVGCPFIAAEQLALRDAQFPDSIRAGVAPVRDRADGIRFVLAPRGPMIPALLTERLDIRGAAIATPEALRQAVMHRCAETIATEAAHAVPAALSYRDGASWGQRIALALVLLLGAIGLIWLPGATSVLLGLVLLGMVALRLGMCFEQPVALASVAQARALPDTELPIYTVVVPLYREAGMVARLLRSLAALDYPSAKLDIKIMIETEDAETAQALAEAEVPAQIEVIVSPPGTPRTKPRALNVALKLARGSFITVYDAEDVPEPGQLRLAVAAFRNAAPDIACLQARLVIDNSADGWLGACFTLEYAALFDVLNPGLAAQHLPVPLGGTSNHFRTDRLRDLHGWDAWNVTEDMDLALRIAREGWRIADLDSATYEEAPAHLAAWMAQRTRWMKGWMQVIITHSRNPRATMGALGVYGTWAVLSLSVFSLVSALGFPLFTAFIVADVVDGGIFRPASLGELTRSTVALVLGSCGIATMVATAWLGARRRGLTHLLPVLPLLLPYYALISLAAWRAVIELLRDPTRWNKTTHGLARSSRSGRLRDSAGNRLPPRPADASG